MRTHIWGLTHLSRNSAEMSGEGNGWKLEMHALPLGRSQRGEDKEMVAAVGSQIESRGGLGIQEENCPCPADGHLGLEEPRQLWVWTELELQGRPLREGRRTQLPSLRRKAELPLGAWWQSPSGKLAKVPQG